MNKPYYYEFSAVINADSGINIQYWMELKEDGWFEAVLIEPDGKEDSNCLNGIVEFSASSFAERAFGLVYSKSICHL